MIFFLIGVAFLVFAYFVYGNIVEGIIGPTDEETPANKLADGVDYVPMNWKKAMLIQFLNIAGTGPIFGAIAGALWGYWAFIWIALGCVFAGAVHDYFAGMLSVRNNGGTVSEIVGKYLGRGALYLMRGFSIVLLVLVGTVFIASPASIIQNIIDPGNHTVFLILVFSIIGYYALSTVLPISKLIGKIYPLFGALMIFMSVGIFIMMFVAGNFAYTPEVTLANINPRAVPIFPFLFITIACGAISGFHATQAPLMARCVQSERDGRKVFYGSMIMEGIVAMIWAAVAMTHFGTVEGLAGAGAAPVVVSTVAMDLLGPVLGVIAVLGVVAAPITSGDTAFRSARLTIADAMKIDQQPIMKRFYLALPLFAIGTYLSFVDFGIIWRYFAWSNQTLATIVLWSATAYLKQSGKPMWITYIPATFMTVVVTSYIIVAPEGFQLPQQTGIIGGLVVGAAMAAWFAVGFKSSPALPAGGAD